MKIKSIHIQNFRSIRDETLTFPKNGLVSLIGANNAGKSNFLRAIDLILGEYWASKEKLEDYDFYGGNRSTTIIIEILFDNDRSVIFNSDEKWPRYLDSRGQKITEWNKPEDSTGQIKDDFPCTYLSADRGITKDLSLNKWSLMGKVAKSFNATLTDEKKLLLNDHFGKVKEIFETVDNFSNFEKDFTNYFDEMQSDSPYKLKINFKPFTPNNYFKTINVLASDSNMINDLDLEELGDGAKTLTILALLRSYAKNFRNASGILAIEEPEIYLHPQARRHLFSVLREIADTGIQVIYTTHDAAFLEFSEFESIRKIYKHKNLEEDGRQETRINSVKAIDLISFAKDTGVTATVTPESIREFYRSQSNLRLSEAFFSRLVILVEGQTEELALPVYLKNSGIDCDKLGISILSVAGKSQIPKYWRLFYKFHIPMIIVFDGDKSKSNVAMSSCFNQNVDLITDLPEAFTYVDFKKETVFTQKAIIFKKDFESTLTDDATLSSISINVLETEAKLKHIVTNEGTPKQVLARWIALKLQEKYPVYCPAFVSKLHDLIEKALASTPAVSEMGQLTNSSTSEVSNTDTEESIF